MHAQGRSTSRHVLNSNSSRSHCVFTVHLEIRNSDAASERAVLAKLNLVDLAGSERTKKTNATGQVCFFVLHFSDCDWLLIRHHLAFAVLKSNCLHTNTHTHPLHSLAFTKLTRNTFLKLQTLREAQCINKSLSFLEQTVTALARKEAHIPFRQSRLTSVLRDALGGNCKVCVIGFLCFI